MESGCQGVWASWSLDVCACRSDASLWCEMGVKMNVLTFEEAVKKTLRALILGLSVLVHCVHGKHRSGAFLCFVLCLIGDNELMETIQWYVKDPLLPYPGDYLRVLRVTQG